MSKNNASQLLLDAKAIRKVSIENAKQFLAEQLVPHLEKIVNKEINEDHSMDMDGEDVEKDEMEDEDSPKLDGKSSEDGDEDSDNEDEMDSDNEDEMDSDDEDEMDSDDEDSDYEDSDDEDLIQFSDTGSDDDDEDISDESDMDDMDIEKKMKTESKKFVSINGIRALKLENVKLRQKLRKALNENAQMGTRNKQISGILKQTALLNAKVGYMFKLVNEGTFNQKQKKVIMESLDEASSISEAKTIYNSLKKMLKSNPSDKIKNKRTGFINEGAISNLKADRKGSENKNDSEPLISESIADKWLNIAGLNEKDTKKLINE